MVLNALQAVLMVMVVMAFGFFAGWRGWATKSVTVFLSNLNIYITLPCTIVMVFLNNFTTDILAESLSYVAAAIIAIVACYVIGKIIAKLIKVGNTRKGVFVTMFTFSNSMSIGLPVALAIFGEKGILFAMFYYIANTVTMNSIGFLEVQRDGLVIAGKQGEKTSVGKIIKQIAQPPLIAIAVGILLVVLKVELPMFLASALDYTGQITTPLALVFVGIILQRTGLSCIKKMNKEMVWMLIGRFAVSPAMMFLIAGLMGTELFATEVLVVQMGLPAMITTTVFAEKFGADTDFAAQGVLVTTLISFATIPLYIAMFHAM